jgi:hypothetical protein
VTFGAEVFPFPNSTPRFLERPPKNFDPPTSRLQAQDIHFFAFSQFIQNGFHSTYRFAVRMVSSLRDTSIKNSRLSAITFTETTNNLRQGWKEGPEDHQEGNAKNKPLPILSAKC